MLCNVLIVDDSSATRSIVRQIVREAGVAEERTFEAGNGQEALAVFEHAWIDLVVLDLNMPVLDGEAFARTIRCRDDLADVRIIVVTSDQTTARHMRLRAIGVDGILTKPFCADELRSLITHCLPQRRAA